MPTTPIMPANKAALRATKPTRQTLPTLPRQPFCIVLDNLKCAHNVGTILRTAEALLAEHVYLTGTTLCPPHGKIRAASRGAEKWVPWSYVADVTMALADLKTRGHYIVACEITDNCVDYSTFTPPRWPVALVMGREYDGVSPGALAMADAVVALPMYGMANSLNVGVSAGVLLYHLNQLCQQTPTPAGR